MVKHITMIAAAGMLSCGAFAQTIPNSGFENWTQQLVYDDPDGWITLNFLSAFGAPPTVIASEDAHSGTYAALLETVTADLDMDGSADTLPGIMTLGTSDFMSGEVTDGAPVTGTPDSLVGWFKFLPVNGDEFGIGVSMSRWDAATQTREVIGYGQFMSSGTIAEYTRIAIPILYTEGTAPDTIVIAISNNAGTATPGTQLFVDDLSLETASVAATPELTTNGLRFAPNPANDRLIIQSQQNEQLTVTNALGAIVQTLTVQAGVPYELLTSDYKNGVYFLLDQQGKASRFVIQH